MAQNLWEVNICLNNHLEALVRSETDQGSNFQQTEMQSQDWIVLLHSIDVAAYAGCCFFVKQFSFWIMGIKWGRYREVYESEGETGKTVGKGKKDL